MMHLARHEIARIGAPRHKVGCAAGLFK